MIKNQYHFPNTKPRRAGFHGVDEMFAWTIFIFLLMGFALFCWIGSFYIFGHPEKATNYHLLMRLHKLEEPQRFELTEAPRGEFLKPKKLLERFSSLSQHQEKRLNDQLLANFLRNYHQTHDLTPYVTETYRVLAAFPLTKKNFFYPGMVALLQSVDQPEILLEQIFTIENDHFLSKFSTASELGFSNRSMRSVQQVIGVTNTVKKEQFEAGIDFKKTAPNIISLQQILTPGQEIKFEKSSDLSAVLHIEKLPDNRLKLTTISLLYGSYGPTSGGPILFSLAPPTHLKVEAGLPLLSPNDLIIAEKQYAAYRTKMGFSNQEETQERAQPSSAFVLQIISNKLTSSAKKLFLKKIPRAKKTYSFSVVDSKEVRPSSESPRGSEEGQLVKEELASEVNGYEKASPISLPAKKEIAPTIDTKTALALPLNTPAVLPSTPAVLPAIPVAIPLPTTTPLSLSQTPSVAEKLSKELSTSNQAVLTPPTSLAPTSTTPIATNDTHSLPLSSSTNSEISSNSLWPTYDPGTMPRGRFVDPSQLSKLAEQGLAGERLYLQGRFIVTASGKERSVLRYQSNNASLTPTQLSTMRIIVAYPTGATPPAEGTSVERNQDRPLMIIDVKKGNDRTLNIYVREITN